MKAFNDLDVDKNGKISKEELVKGYSRIKGFSSQDIDEVFRKYDSDGSGMIDYSGNDP